MDTNHNHSETQSHIATVLFTDIHGFVHMANTMKPDDLICLINCWFEIAEPVIDFYGGTIDKFIGDCVMAVFGVPENRHDDPQRAVRAAIEIRKALYRFNVEKNLTVPMELHIGINTGVVVAGVVGGIRKREPTVIGDTVNIAAQLEDISEEGQILVGSATYEATKGEFEYREVKHFLLKSSRRTIPVYELVPVYDYRRS
jgi:class 3 adenylate cyclase